MKPQGDVTPKPERVAQADPWQKLQQFTQARIGLGRAGVSIPSKAQLQFNLDHALARDAVNTPLNLTQLGTELSAIEVETVVLHSQAQNRSEYLQRPDFGRQLNGESQQTLKAYQTQHPEPVDVALVLVDGLSSTAVQQNSVELVRQLRLACAEQQLSTSALFIVQQGRVAVGDAVGQLIGAKSVLLMVGERPGLSSPDSLGIYYTFAPKIGLTDASRNCISNIRPQGLCTEEAVQKALWLINESRQLQLSGVNLKDRSDSQGVKAVTGPENGNFLLPNHES